MSKNRETDGAVAGDASTPVRLFGREKWVVLAALLLCAAVGVGMFWWINHSGYDDKLDPNAVVGSMPGKTEEQVQAELNQHVAEKMIAFTINSEITYPDGKSPGNVLFENPSANEDKLTRMELYLGDGDSGELLYKTGLLQPGSYVPEAPLSVDLDAGTYACTGYIYAYRQSDESYIGKVAVGVSVIVQN